MPADAKTFVVNAPAWIDLSSTDPDKARDFYSKLFGWEATPEKDPAAGGYAIARLDGKDIAGIGGTQDPQAPSAWMLYIGTKDAGAVVKRACAEHGWYDASTLKEPYRVEGKKTMGFELAEQLGWELPDVIVCPTGGGVGLIGMWKAFEELRAVGWLPAGEKAPRFVCVQAAGCAPIVKAFHEEKDESDQWPDPVTLAAGLRVPKALGDFLVLRILRDSRGVAIDVPDERILEMMRVVGVTEGLLACPEGAAAFEAAHQLRQAGMIHEHEDVVVFNTGTGMKYVEHLQGRPPARLRRDELMPRIERELEDLEGYHRPLAVEEGRLRVAPDEEGGR